MDRPISLGFENMCIVIAINMLNYVNRACKYQTLYEEMHFKLHLNSIQLQHNSIFPKLPGSNHRMFYFNRNILYAAASASAGPREEMLFGGIAVRTAHAPRMGNGAEWSC